MKLATLLAAVFILSAGHAYAGPKHHKRGNPATQQQTQLQGMAQAQGQITTVGGASVVIPNEEIPVSTAYAPNVYPTAPCMGSSSAGGQGLNIGLSFGTSWESKQCLILETARSFEQAGAKDDAMAIRCQAKYAQAAPSCLALTAKLNGHQASKNGNYSVVTNPIAK